MKENKKITKIYAVLIKYKNGNATKITMYEEVLNQLKVDLSLSRTSDSHTYVTEISAFGHVERGGITGDKTLSLELKDVQHIEWEYMSTI